MADPTLAGRAARSALALLLLEGMFLGLPLAAAKTPSKPKGPPPPQSLLEAEYELAKEIDLYLVLRPRAKVLEVRSRGITLSTIPLLGSQVLRYSPPRSAAVQSGEVPQFYWTVAEDADGSHRKLIAPDRLRPYPEEDAAEEEESTPLPVATAPTGAAAPLPEPPTDYRIRLDGGWQLWVTHEVPRTDLLSRLKYALREGWGRLRGRQPETQDQLVLIVEGKDAQRLQHLFRAGTKILLESSSS